MSLGRMLAAAELPNLTDDERLVLMAIASFENEKTGVCNPTDEQIYKRTLELAYLLGRKKQPKKTKGGLI